MEYDCFFNFYLIKNFSLTYIILDYINYLGNIVLLLLLQKKSMQHINMTAKINKMAKVKRPYKTINPNLEPKSISSSLLLFVEFEKLVVFVVFFPISSNI